LRRLALLLCFQVVLAGAVAAKADDQAPGRYIVLLRRHVDASAKASDHAKRFGIVKSAVYHHAISGYAASIHAARLAALRADRDVVSVFPDVVAHAAAQTVPTGVQRIRTLSSSGEGNGTDVAILDTGIDLDHPDLTANIAGGKNCSTGSSYNDSSSSGHGTHVAGIVAAANNSIGVRGVAPAAKLWAVRVLDASGSGDYATLLCGMDFVDAKSPANGGNITVANMSIEASGSDDGNCGNTDGDPLHQAICQVVADGVTVVVAAGNFHEDIKNVVPAGWDEVITASALSDSDGQPCGNGAAGSFGSDDTFTSFSSYASTAQDRAHIMGAPGDDITSTMNNGAYAVMSGTSMASPHIAGAAALYIAEHPGSTPAAVLAGLKAVGEAPNVDYNGECSGGSSHTDPSGKHAEDVVAIVPALFTLTTPANATSPVSVHFNAPVNGLDDTNLVLRLASGGADLPASVSYDSGTQVATIDPDDPLVPGQHYTVTVAPAGSTPPTDGNGDPLPETSRAFRGALLEQENSAWSTFYWRAISNSAAYGGKLVQDRTAGAWVTFTFTGSSVAWYTMRGPDQGQARVEIDGVVKGTYDNYRSTAQYRVKHSWGLSAGTHTIRVVALGKKSAAATNYYASVDAFGVGSTLYSNPTLTASWRAQTMDIASGDRLVMDSSSGANVYFHFRGTGIDWRTLLGPEQGYAKVYVDGVYKGQFDNYAVSTRAYSRPFRGLSDALHDIRIVVSGTKRSTSTNTLVSLDYWRVV
jgi:subtilisin